MVPFDYTQSLTVASATASLAGHRSDRVGSTDFFAGGTDMMQLMKEGLRHPDRIVDVTAIAGLDRIEETTTGLHLGSMVRMSDAASNPLVLRHFPIVSEALLASASAQVRNLATLGGNLLQRTRCGYFRDPGSPCNKREPGSGCPAYDGQNRFHAIVGGSSQCIATYAGDFANALTALDARIRIAGSQGEREIAISALHRAPGETPWLETSLAPGDLIVGVDLPAAFAGWRMRYLKVRDRASFEWALVSAAVAMDLDANGTVRDLRIAAGGIGTTPWRLPHVESVLRGRQLTPDLARQASARAAEGAQPRTHNAFKEALVERAVFRAIVEAGDLR